MKLFDRHAAVRSTSGSVLRYVLEKDACFRARMRLLITDRPCGAEAVAARFNIRVVRLEEGSNLAFSDRLMDILVAESIDYAFVFFSRILSGEVLKIFSNRLLNFHPSLLPAFPGLSGFEDAWRSSALVLGSTVHFVDAGIDTGDILQQAFLSVDRAVRNKSDIRHKIFLQQAASLSQVSDWLAKGRVGYINTGRATVCGANYEGQCSFVPALESHVAKHIAAGMEDS